MTSDDLAEAKRPWDRVRAAIADAIIWRDATAGDWDDVNAGYLDAIISAYSAAGANATSDLVKHLDAEGQRVEGGDEDERKWLVWYHDPDMPPELIVRGGNAEEAARKRHAEQLNAWSCHLFREVFPGEQVASGAELTRLKAAQPEHDRTVRLEALEEIAAYCDAQAEDHMRTHAWESEKRSPGAPATRLEHELYYASEVYADVAVYARSLIDQTGGEGGNG